MYAAPCPFSAYSLQNLLLTLTSVDHWASMLAPTSWSYFLSYITAWLTTLAWQAACCSASYLFATLLQGIVVLARPAYRPEASHTVLIIWAAALLATTLNLINSRKLAKLESLILILHLAGFFGILIPMVYLSPYNDASFVFTGFTNNGLWPSQGIAFMVAYPSLASSILGADCAVHMSEEVQNAAKVVPQALMYAVTINGALATGIAIAFVFCITDLEAAVASVGTIFYPCLEVFRSATDSTVGACLMGGILLVLGFTAVIGNFASASRMLWSFARDGGLPLSSVLVKVRGAFDKTRYYEFQC
jgi:amino acid transporter